MAVTEQPYPDSGLFTFDLCMGILFELCSVILISTVTHYGFKFIGVYERLNGKHSFKQISGKTAKKDRALVEGQIGSHAVSANCNHASTVDSDTATGSVHLKWRSQKDGIKTDARPYKRPSTNAYPIGKIDIRKKGTVPTTSHTVSENESQQREPGRKVVLSSTEMSKVLQRRYNGIVSTCASEHCWGSITCHKLYYTIHQNVLLHKDQMGDFSLGERITFEVVFDDNGLVQAKNLLRRQIPILPGHEEKQQKAKSEQVAWPISSVEPLADQVSEQVQKYQTTETGNPQEPRKRPSCESSEGGEVLEGDMMWERGKAWNDGQFWNEMPSASWLEGPAWRKGKGMDWDEPRAWDIQAGAKGWPAGKDMSKGLWWRQGAMWSGKGVWGKGKWCDDWQVLGKGKPWYEAPMHNKGGKAFEGDYQAWLGGPPWVHGKAYGKGPLFYGCPM